MDIRILSKADRATLDKVAEDVFDNPISGDLTSEFLEDPRHHICVAIDDGAVVGFASALHYVHPDKPAELWINEVGVAPTHQRRGIAGAILKTLLAHGRSLGCAEAWVLTDDENTAARALYKSAGGGETRHVMVSFDLEAAEAAPER